MVTALERDVPNVADVTDQQRRTYVTKLTSAMTLSTVMSSAKSADPRVIVVSVSSPAVTSSAALAIPHVIPVRVTPPVNISGRRRLQTVHTTPESATSCSGSTSVNPVASGRARTCMLREMLSKQSLADSVQRVTSSQLQALENKRGSVRNVQQKTTEHDLDSLCNWTINRRLRLELLGQSNNNSQFSVGCRLLESATFH